MRKSEEDQRSSSRPCPNRISQAHGTQKQQQQYCRHCCKMLHSLCSIDVTRDTSQASMAPWVEPALQFAPVPDVQGPLLAQYEVSVPSLVTMLHAPTHPKSDVCSALRSAGANAIRAWAWAPSNMFVIVAELPVQADPRSTWSNALAERNTENGVVPIHKWYIMVL